MLVSEVNQSVANDRCDVLGFRGSSSAPARLLYEDNGISEFVGYSSGFVILLNTIGGGI